MASVGFVVFFFFFPERRDKFVLRRCVVNILSFGYVCIQDLLLFDK